MSMIDDKTNPTLSQASPRPAQETQVCGIPKIRRVVFVFFSPRSSTKDTHEITTNLRDS